MLEKLNAIPKDKLLHFFVGALISFPLVYLFTYYGFLVSLLIFASKEIIIDKIYRLGKMEYRDFISTSIQALFYLIIKVL